MYTTYRHQDINTLRRQAKNNPFLDDNEGLMDILGEFDRLIDEIEKDDTGTMTAPPGPLETYVLVMDENVNTYQNICKCLGTRGYKVLWAPDTIHAFYYIRKKNPSLIIMEVTLKGKSSFETYGNIRESGFDIPAIVLSNLECNAYNQDAGKYGIINLLQKPLDAEVFLGIVEEILE